MQLDTASNEDVMVVTVREDRLDAAIALEFKDAMRDLTSDGPPRVVLDMRQVRFLDSSGLGAVIGAMKHLGNRRRLELASLTPPVEKVFRLTRMDTIFLIHANIHAALNGASLNLPDAMGREHAC